MRFEVKEERLEKLEASIKAFPGDAEKVINDVFWNEGAEWIEENIRRLTPTSGRRWSGKKAAAKTGKSLTEKKENLAITVKTRDTHHYLYFPDDGTNTRRHIGNKQFFKRGGEQASNDIISRCISRLVNDFEEKIN